MATSSKVKRLLRKKRFSMTTKRKRRGIRRISRVKLKKGIYKMRWSNSFLLSLLSLLVTITVIYSIKQSHLTQRMRMQLGYEQVVVPGRYDAIWQKRNSP